MSQKSLSVASIIEKNKLSSASPWLIALDIQVIDPLSGQLVETLYVVRNSEPIQFNGNIYQESSFDLELKEQANAQPTVQLTFNDYTRALQARMQAYGGGVGFKVNAYIVNAGNLGQGPELTEYFEVIGASAQQYVCTFTLGAENTVMQTFPRRMQTRDYCQWRYRSPECGYNGPNPSCDLSFKGPNGCAAHNNTINFGGFPAINQNNLQYAG
jgi:hypothetical protein